MSTNDLAAFPASKAPTGPIPVPPLTRSIRDRIERAAQITAPILVAVPIGLLFAAAVVFS